ncbi:Heat shock protein GrpE [Moraxella catarrhalis]|nr:Heat shock protein GrpE [Moraxella catarrhalis]
MLHELHDRTGRLETASRQTGVHQLLHDRTGRLEKGQRHLPH